MSSITTPTTDFQYLLNMEIEQMLKDYEEKKHFGLRKYQLLVKEYLTDHLTKHKVRGLLFYMGLGTGKTLAAVSTALALNRKCLFISNKTLVDNFKETISKYAHMNRAISEAEAKSRFVYATINASNLIHQVEQKTGGFALNGMCIIIEECQDFFRMVINGSKNAVLLYNAIMSTADIKLIFLSGTPVESNVFSLVPCFNMLRGKRYFPETEDDFNGLFIEGEWGSDQLDIDGENGLSLDYDTMESIVKEGKSYRVRNEWLFKNAITGLVSYVRQNDIDFPKLLPIIQVDMSLEITRQLPQYRLMREKEENEAKRKGKFSKGDGYRPMIPQGIGEKKKKSAGSFRKGTRMVSNVFEDICPKIDAMVRNMDKEPGKSVAYSQFREFGVDAIAKKLLDDGWQEIFPSELGAEFKETKVRKGKKIKEQEVKTKELEEQEIKVEDEDENPEAEPPVGEIPKELEEKIKDKTIKRFVRLHGDLSSEDRLAIIKAFNSEKNYEGQYIKSLLFTVVAATGISLNATRSCHILEPFFHMSRIRQVIGRCVRQFSHHMFPVEKRTVQPYIYIAVCPKEADKQFLTSDQILYQLSKKRQEVIDKFMLLLKESAIDCSAYGNQEQEKLHCHICRPSPIFPLSTDDIFYDSKAEDPCIPFVEEKIEAKNIVIDNIAYSYTRDNDDAKDSIYGLAIYKFDPDLNVHIKILESDEIFPIIRKKILEEENNS